MKRTFSVTALALALTGCASLTPGDEIADVNRLTQAHTGQALALEPLSPDALAERLREPLNADAAVQLAL
ncbi:MAG TPA: RND transporter, partial [Roseateles sp.]